MRTLRTRLSNLQSSPARRGVVASTGTLVTQGITQFGSLVLFLPAFGQERYADWLILFSIPAYLAMSDLGFAAASNTAATKAYARAERLASYSYWQRGTVIQFCVLTSLALIVFVATMIAPAGSWLALRTLSPTEARAAIGILLIYSAFSAFSSSVEALWRSQGRYATGISILNSLRLFEFAIAVAFAFATSSIVATAMTLALCRGGLLVVWWLTTSKDLETYRWNSWRRVRLGPHVFKAGLGYASFSAAFVLTSQAMLVIANHYLAASLVVMLSAIRVITSLIRQAALTLALGPLPTMSALIAVGDVPPIRSIVRKTQWLIGGITCVLAVLILAIAPFAIGLLVEQPKAVSLPVIALFCVSVIIDSLWLPRLVLLLSNNSQAFFGLCYLLTCTAGVVAVALLISHIGLLSVPLVTVCLSVGALPLAWREGNKVLLHQDDSREFASPT